MTYTEVVFYNTKFRKKIADMDEKRVNTLKAERQKLEKEKKKMPLWSVLDDSLFNKLQPSINSAYNEFDEFEKGN